MLRLYHSFNGTKYAIPKYIVIIFIVLIIIWVLNSFTSVILHCIAYLNSDDNLSKISYGTYQIGMEITDLIISVFLIMLFINKMIKVTVDLHSIKSHILINDEISRLNDNQKVLLNIIAKYFVLSFIATTWTQISCLFFCVVWVLYVYDHHEAYIVAWDIMDVFWYLDGIINPICLYLIFEINDKYYQKFCNGSHSFARLCFRRCTQRELRKKKWTNIDQHLQVGLL